MKDVISVDTILAGVFLEGAEVPQTDNPDKDLDVYIERSGYHIPIAQAKLYSLLISKLPEKIRANSAFVQVGNPTLREFKQAEANGFNQAIDEMHRVIDELFEVGDE